MDKCGKPGNVPGFTPMPPTSTNAITTSLPLMFYIPSNTASTVVDNTNKEKYGDVQLRAGFPVKGP